MDTVEQQIVPIKTPDTVPPPNIVGALAERPFLTEENISRNLNAFEPTGDPHRDSVQLLKASGYDEYVEAMQGGRIPMKPAEFLESVRESKKHGHTPSDHEADASSQRSEEQTTPAEERQANGEEHNDLHIREVSLMDKVLKAKDRAKEEDEPSEQHPMPGGEPREHQQNPEVVKKVDQLQGSVDRVYRKAIVDQLRLQGREQQVVRDGMKRFRDLQERFPGKLPESFFFHLFKQNNIVLTARLRM